MHYLKQKPKSSVSSPPTDRVKALVLLGSMGKAFDSLQYTEIEPVYIASWQAPGTNVMYGASKHAVLGIMRSLNPTCNAAGIRVGIVHPWFAGTHRMSIKYLASSHVALVDTPMLTSGARLMLAGLPLAPLSRIASTIVHIATDPDQKTSGCPWILPDGGEVLRLDKELLKEGVYKILGERLRFTMKTLRGVRYASRIARDVIGLLVPVATVMGGIFLAWVWAAPYLARARGRL